MLNEVKSDLGGKRQVDIDKRTFAFAVEIVKLGQKLDKTPGVSRILSRQLVRSGTSVGANVEEAQAGHSKADFIAKIVIAAKEARETHYWLRLLSTCGLIPMLPLQAILKESDELVAILTSIVKSSRKAAA